MKRKRQRKRQRKLKCIRILSMIIILGGLLSILTLKLYVKASDGSEIVIFKYDKEVSEATAYGEPVYDESLYQIVESSEGSPIVKDVRLDTDVESKLSLLAAEDEEIAQIYADKNNYPEELLTALANNPELKEFVKGYLASDGTAMAGLNEEELSQDFPLLLQWDSRWGYVPYGKTNIGISGCGPTCMAMVIFSLTRDATATPDALASYSMKNGYYSQGAGTSWLFMTDAAKAYGLNAKELGLDEESMKNYLDSGRPIICAMRPGDFTTMGHFIMIYGYDKDGFLINDPNSRERSSRHWDFDTLHYQIKNLWGYYI